jgi:hypothetical protein
MANDLLALFNDVLESLRDPIKAGTETQEELTEKLKPLLEELKQKSAPGLAKRPCSCQSDKRGGNHYNWCDSQS